MRRITLISLVFSSFIALAQTGGKSAYPFLNIATSARVAGTAGTALANTDEDVVFAFWNPALLRKEMHGRMVFSFANTASDINFGEAMYAHHFEKAGTFLLGMKYVNYGNFLRTNQNAQVLGNFTASDYSAQLGYAYHLTENWWFGADLKFINSVYENFNSWGLSSDLAATYYKPEKRLSMTLILKNMGYQFDPYADTREDLPFEIQYSISNRFEHLPFRWMITLENLQQWDLTYNDPNSVSQDPITGDITVTEPGFANKFLRHVVVGGELAPSENFNIQLGFDFRRSFEMRIPTRRSSAGLTFGLGFRISKFRINYANTYMHLSNRMHHVSITTSLGKFKKSNPPEEP